MNNIWTYLITRGLAYLKSASVVSLILFLVPYKTIHFFYTYWDVIKVIHAKQHGQALSEKNEALYKLVTNRFRRVHLITNVKFVHLIYLLCYPPRDLFHALINVDLIKLSGFGPKMQLLPMVSIFLTTHYFRRNLFDQFPPFFVTLFYDVFRLQKLHVLYLPPFQYRAQSILTYVIRVGVRTINAMQMTLVVFCKYSLCKE